MPAVCVQRTISGTFIHHNHFSIQQSIGHLPLQDIMAKCIERTFTIGLRWYWLWNIAQKKIIVKRPLPDSTLVSAMIFLLHLESKFLGYLFVHRWMGPCLFYRTLFEMCCWVAAAGVLGTRQDFFISFNCCFIWSRLFVTQKPNEIRTLP